MVLVSVLGDFHSSILPIIYNFKDDISTHILIYDDFKRDVAKANEIKKGIKRFKKKYAYDYTLLEYIVNEDSYEALNDCSKFILSNSKFPEDIFINTTDGFSTLTTVLNHKLFDLGVNFLAYDMYDNEYNILNNESLTKYKLENNLNIQDHFLLKGYETEAKEFKSFAHTHEDTIKLIFEKYHDKFNKYVKLPREDKKLVINLPDGKIKELFIKLGLKDLPAHDALLTGGLFEYYIYNLLKDLEYDDIEVGLIVNRMSDESKVPNEFDILIMKNNHLHTIECKYRQYVNKNDLIYKYTALSNIIDEDGKTIIILKNPISIEENNSLASLKRASLSGITFKGGVHLNPKLFSTYIKVLLELRGD